MSVDKTYKSGKTLVKLRTFPDKSGLSVKDFNHPYSFRKSLLVDILSSVYYIDKNLMKSVLKNARKARRVFQDHDISRLTPLIINAFARAAPGQDLWISSYSERFLREELNTVFTLFMTGDTLNIAFGKIREKGSVSKSSVVNTMERLNSRIEPTNRKGSHFWTLVPKPGQRFKPDHKNWLLIDFKNDQFAKGVAERNKIVTGKYDKKLRPYVDPLEDRIKKLEQMLADNNDDNGGDDIRRHRSDQTIERRSNGTIGRKQPADTKAKEVGAEEVYDVTGVIPRTKDRMDIDTVMEKFYALQELLEEELITFIDYENKKREMLNNFPSFNVKSSLKELKRLKEMGFISNADFEDTKTRLLRNF